MVDFTQGNWQITDNADWLQSLIFNDQNGEPYDFTGSTFRLDLKTSRDAASATLSMTTGNGKILSTDIANGTITLKVAAADLAKGSYLGELMRVTGSVREFLMLVNVNVEKGVT